MTKQLILEPEKCVNCRSCELICSFAHEGVFNPALSDVTVFDFEEAMVTVPVMCLQCDEAYCAAICPTNALVVEEDGFVSYSKDACIGCKLCIHACPFGNIAYSSTTRKIHKCDLCGGDPQCVAWCAPGAISYLDPDETHHRKKAVAEALCITVAEEVA